MKIRIKEASLQKQIGHFVIDDDIIILPNYTVYRVKRVMQVFALLGLLFVMGGFLFCFIKLPQSIHVKPVERVYAIGDNSKDHYKVMVTSIFGEEYASPFANINVCFGVGDNLDVRASLFRMFYDTIRVVPIAQDGADAVYTKTVYEGDVLDAEYVRTFIRFKDGHEIDQDWDVVVPTDPVIEPVKICIKMEQFHRFYITVIPVMSTDVVAKYEVPLYQGDALDMSKVSWFLSYEDGYEREIDNVEASVDSFFVEEQVVFHVISEFYSGDVKLDAIPIEKLSAVYRSNTPVYEGDLLDESCIEVTGTWSDGLIRKLKPLEFDASDLGHVIAGQALMLTTNLGDVLLNIDVIGVRSVTVDGGQSSYIEGDLISPLSFQFYYDDDTQVNVWTNSVNLSNDWYSPLQSGDNAYRLTYHGVQYVCHISAYAKPYEPSVEFTEPSEDNVAVEESSDQIPSQNESQDVPSDVGNDIEVIPGESQVEFPSDSSDDMDDDIIIN